MLSIENEQVKNVTERLSDAMLTIPIYDPEWTNFNPSDPGMTILDTISVSNIMLESAMDFIPPMVRLRLLAMAGIKPRKAKNTKVLMGAEGIEEPLLLPAHQRFSLGDISFETDKLTSVYGCRLTGAFTTEAGKDRFSDIGFVLDSETSIPANVFGKKPEKDNAVYFFADSLPPAGEEVICYALFEEYAKRNPLSERNRNMFASIVWECYCEDGFKELAVRDYTAGFLITGELRFRVPENAAVYADGPIEGYCIRARLDYANYDVAPRLISFSAFLFDVWQKETKCTAFTFQKPSEARLYSDFAETGYMRIYVKEESGKSYRIYEANHAEDEKGRFVDVVRHGFGQYEFLFNKQKYGYGPDRVKNAIRVVMYTAESMRQYRVGQVFGYDNQEIELPYNHIVRGSFCLIAERKLPSGEKIYDFVRPDMNEDGSLYYHLLENEGRVVIEDAGDYIGAELFLASLATSRGSDGNVLKGKIFKGENLPDEITFSNPAPGVGGAFSETFEEMRDRFFRDVHSPYVAVCAKDYEDIAMKTPGLCISKVHAVMNEDLNLVEVVVLPYSDSPNPVLSDTYKALILEQLMERRLLTTRIELRDPKFVSVNVRGTLSVRRGYEKEAREKVQAALLKTCEYRLSDKTFGEPLYYSDVFRNLERIDEVDYVYDLSIRPSGSANVKLSEGNVYPDSFVLCTLGSVDIEYIHS
ncbi:MAG: baseplate J/gp47 family protein [Lachnospiraceae bacterium]|nr:baseplate J/gp47 family protein [Lachnospiraceae bacterium]